jgi:hypothetical protein
MSVLFRLLCCCLFFSGALPLAARVTATDGITFDAVPNSLFIPLDEVTRLFSWSPAWDPATKGLILNTTPIPADATRQLPDGTLLVSTSALISAGASQLLSSANPRDPATVLQWKRRTLRITPAPQRAEINLAEQKLRAWQGQRLILETKVSSGRNGRTPAGNFKAGPYKARMHRSSRYQNAPMPWSVQINGHIFIHGFSSVPDYPASHGCIRVPLTGPNPARFFYEWIHRGTPVAVIPSQKR